MSDLVKQLCNQAKAGDSAAACELVTVFYARIFAYFRRLCGNEADAEDLTQKTFLKVWNALATFEGRSAFSTWLHGIAHHVYVDWRRRSNRLETQSDDWWDGCLSAATGPFEDVAQRDSACQLYRAVDRLDEGMRETIHLHYYQGLSLSETAEALGVAVSTVKYRLRDALDILRKRMAEPRNEIRGRTCGVSAAVPPHPGSLPLGEGVIPPRVGTVTES